MRSECGHHGTGDVHWTPAAREVEQQGCVNKKTANIGYQPIMLQGEQTNAWREQGWLGRAVQVTDGWLSPTSRKSQDCAGRAFQWTSKL